MSHPNPEHPKVRASKEKIVGAVVVMLDKTPFEDLSISSICRKAGVSRQTFYRIYDSKEDVMLEHLDDLLSRIADDDSVVSDRNALFKKLGELFASERAFLERLFSAGLDSYVMARFESLLRELGKSARPGGQTDYLETFLAGGVFYVMRKWLLVSTAPDPSDITALIGRLSGPLVVEAVKVTDQS